MSVNRLATETSPYLLQHKDNPVHWQAWGEEAFAQARREDKPVLLSVGYAACHWCHVMAHESFEDADTAALMNSHFVNIKVDREERPDVDRIYMQALHSLGEQGGWPLTMFLDPEGRPFWGGTYFPPETRYGRPGFRHVLREIARIWRDERGKALTNATALLNALRSEKPVDRAELSFDVLRAAADAFADAVDFTHGGLKGAPKFPQVPLFNFLWTMARRTDDEKLERAVTVTLTHISQGGIYDHLGGGFARYAVDHRWLVPHFEKMLYDNAQLVSLLTRVWLVTKSRLFHNRIDETIAFIVTEMQTPIGAFAASYDADSEGEEGKYYVWEPQEVATILPPGDLERFARIYELSATGNWEGKTILNRLGSLALLSDEDEARLATNRSALLARRRERIPPGFDDKVLADWNGLMIAALAEAAAVFARQDWAEAALAAFEGIMKTLWAGGRLHHSWRQGKVRHEATGEGYANLISAALAIAQIAPNADHLASAVELTETMIRLLWDDERSAFTFASPDASMLIVRTVSGHDDATPNSNAVMIANLVRLHHLTGNPRYLELAEKIHQRFATEALNNPFGFATLLNAFTMLAEPAQLVMTGEGGDPFTSPLFRHAIGQLGPDAIIQWTNDPSSLPASHPAHGKSAGASLRAYICRGNVCAMPAETPEQIDAALELLGITPKSFTAG
jgi:uncharacterized protein YyaL (SSP411 family)